MTSQAVRGTGSRKGPWGVYDTADRCWTGPPDGRPYVYDHKQGAVEACRRISKRFGLAAGRLQPRTYDPEDLKYKDSIAAPPDDPGPPTLRIVG